jgi:hypothetical protein
MSLPKLRIAHQGPSTICAWLESTKWMQAKKRRSPEQCAASSASSVLQRYRGMRRKRHGGNGGGRDQSNAHLFTSSVA